MTRPIIQNFRGARALVLLEPGDDRDRLVLTLRRLGLLAGVVDPNDTVRLDTADREGFDVLICDTDVGTGDLVPAGLAVDAPVIAVIGVEAPSRLTRVVNSQAASHIVKPVRSSGVFPALFIAFNEFARRKREQEYAQKLEARLRQRRAVVKAVLSLVATRAVDEDEAFKLLRRESMQRRITIEALSQEIIDAAGENPSQSEAAGGRML